MTPKSVIKMTHRYELRMRQRSITKPTKYDLSSMKISTHNLPAHILQSMTSKFPIVVLNDIGQHLAQCLPCAFMNINDDCILEILERLPLTDLCNMAEVSVRLKQLTEFVFRLKYRKLNIKLLALNDERIEMKQARSLFTNFGHLIQSLHISRKLFMFDLPTHNPFNGQIRLLRLIRKYCLESLDTLTLGHFWMNSEMITEAMPIFKRVQTLNHYRLSCYCPELKAFYNFSNVLPLIFEQNGVSHQLPSMIQLI